MRFSLAAATAALAGLAQGRIIGLSVPETVKPGESVEVIIQRENYIQAVYDVAVAFGATAGKGYPGTLGEVAGSFYLGPVDSNDVAPLPKRILIPKGIAKGEGLITASVFSLYGKSTTPTLQDFNVTVTFGDKTSTKHKKVTIYDN